MDSFKQHVRSLLFENYNQQSEKFENIETIIESCGKKYPELKEKIKKSIKLNIKMISNKNNNDSMSASSRSTPSPRSAKLVSSSEKAAANVSLLNN